MKAYLWILCVVSMGFHACSSTTAAQTNNLKPTTNFNQTATNLIFKYTKQFPKNTQISIARIHQGSVDFYATLRENDSVEMTDGQNKVFGIGSISKIFTSTMLANMVINDKLTLDDNIPLTLHKQTNITYKQLANHSSGLPSMPPFSKKHPYENYSGTDLESYMKDTLKVEEQGKHAYSNLGVSILGYTLGKIEHKSYETLLQELITQKYHMHDTTTQEDKIKDNLVLPTKKETEAVPPAFVGAGGIYSSVKDLSKFAFASFNERDKALHLTQQKTFHHAFTSGTRKFSLGLGWYIYQTTYADAIHWHNGSTSGYVSTMMLDIPDKTGIIILSNVPLDNHYMDNIDILAERLMALIY